MARLKLLLIFTLCVEMGCRKNNYETLPSDLGHAYLPLKNGDIFIYKADSIVYGYHGSKPSGDSISFFIKEEVTHQFSDSTKTVYTLSRFISKDSTAWHFVKNHFYEVEALRINHKENNCITTSLIFPVQKYLYWNGNQFNALDPKDFEYSMVNYPLVINHRPYVNCLKIKIDSILNLRQNIIESEVYSKDCGLIFTETKNILLINNDSLDKQGNVVLQRPPKIEKGKVFTKSLLYKR